jgi:hypothetical protein
VLATQAEPLPVATTSGAPGSKYVGGSTTGFPMTLPTHLPIFAPVLWLDQYLLSLLELVGRVSPRLGAVPSGSINTTRRTGYHARGVSYIGVGSGINGGNGGFTGRIAQTRRTFEGEEGDDIEAGDGMNGFDSQSTSGAWGESVPQSRKFD